MKRSDHLERTNLSTRALDFLLHLQDFDLSQDESIGTLCVLAEKLQPAPSWAAPSSTVARLHSTGLFFPACQPRPSARSVNVRLRRPILEPAHRRCVRED